MNATQIAKTLGTLKSLRSPHESVWRDCYDHSYPIRGSGFNGESITAMEAQTRKARMLDSTTTDAARILASTIMSGLTPANSLWFNMDVGNETEDERRWLDESADILWQNIHAANFDAAAFEGLLDAVCAGWFALYIGENQGKGGFNFDLWPIASVYCSASVAGGKIDTIYREYTLTAEQAVKEFGADNVSEQTRKLADDKPQEAVKFLHCITPRSVYAVGGRLAKNMPFASYKVEVDQKTMVSESGFHEFPVVVPRWMMIPDSVYAVGAMFDALPDARTLNELCRMDLAAGDLAIAGMWIAEDDGVLNPRTVKVGPRKIIIANSVDSMKPLQPGSNFQYADAKILRLQASIRKTLMADSLPPADKPAVTATEIHARMNLVRQLLGPVYGRFQAEYLQPLIERCFGIAYRAGVLGQAPESLGGRNFTVRYLSPLARAQKLQEVTAIDQVVASALEVSAATQSLEPLDNIDMDAALQFKGEALGVPSSIMRSTAEVDEKRKQRAEEQQAAQQQAQQQQMQAQVADAAIKQQGAAA